MRNLSYTWKEVYLFLTNSLLISLWKHLWSFDCFPCVCSSNAVSNQAGSYLLPGSADPLSMLDVLDLCPS